MKTTGQIAAFLVMVAALVATAWVVGNQDLDSQANTAAESRLPQIFDSNTLLTGEISDFQMRYPRGWQVEASEGGLEVSRAVENLDRQGPRYAFSFVFLPNVELSGPADLLNSPVASATSPEGSPYVWARAEREDPNGGGILIEQPVQLNAEGDYLLINTQTPIAEGDVESVLADVDDMVASITLGENFAIVQPVYSFQAPENWAEAPSPDRTLVQLVYPAASVETRQFEAIVSVQLGDSAATLGILNEFVPVPEGVAVAEASDPLAFMQAFEGFVGDGAVQLAQVLTPAEAMGYSGLELGFVQTAAQSSELYVTVLDTGDGFYTVILRAFLASPSREQYLADIASFIGSLSYNADAAQTAAPPQN